MKGGWDGWMDGFGRVGDADDGNGLINFCVLTYLPRLRSAVSNLANWMLGNLGGPETRARKQRRSQSGGR